VSKLSPMGQSMAALFTPESDKLRAARKEKSATAAGMSGSFRIPGTEAVKEGAKCQDSLGNPMSPGYEPMNLSKPESEAPTEEAPKAGEKAQGIQAPKFGPHFIRLAVGWEKILFTQKKLCEKAKGIFTLLDGPGKYSRQRKASILEEKSRGSILDLDVEEARVAAEPEKKDAA